MPSWKKVIVSGSQTHLSGITSSVLTQNNLLIANAGGAIANSGVTLSGNTLALGSNSITSTGANSVLTGSFAGTFSGSLTVNLQDLTAGDGIESFTYDGNSAATVQAAVTASSGDFLYWATPIGKSRFSGSAGLGYDSLNDRITLSKVLAPNTTDTVNIGVNSGLRFNQVYVRDIFARTLELSLGITATGSLIVNGNTTLGDASGDSVTVNAQTLTLANQLAVGALSSTMLVITSSNRVATQTLGTGVATALGINVGSAGAPVLFNGAGGTPSSITLTNGTGLPISTGVSGLGTGIATFLATPSSANLAAAVTNETGTGNLVFSVSPSFTGTVGAADITTTGNLIVSGSTTLGDASGDSVTVNAATIGIANVGAGTTDTVLIRDGSNTIKTRTIDTRVWGSTLISGSGTANQIAYFNASTGIAGDAGLTYNAGTDTVTVAGDLAVNGGDITTTATNFNLLAGATGTLTIGAAATTTTLPGDLAVNGGDITTTATNFNLLAGATGTLTIGASATNVTIPGNLFVNGSTTVIDTSNLSIQDKFIVLGRLSGSQAPAAEGGIIVEGAGGSGSAFVFNSGSGAGVSNRWGIALSVATGSADVTPTDFMVSAIQASGAPSSAPTYGGSNGGFGNIYVNSSDESIWIYS